MTHSPPTNTSGSEDRGGHTKGPWTVAKGVPHVDRTTDVLGASGVYVAACNESFAIQWQEKLANARLIAAAPELLEAVQSLKKAFGDPITRRALGGHSEQQQIAILNASAAISRATGSPS